MTRSRDPRQPNGSSNEQNYGGGFGGNRQPAQQRSTDGVGERPVGSSARGFAAMDPRTQREIAAKGGRAAHASGNAHEFNSAEAAAAGRKGGQARAANQASAAARRSARSAPGND